MPISSATKTARRGSARLNVKPPVGPLNSTESPGLSARSHWEPSPPGATSTASVMVRLRTGEDSMLHARTTLGPNGTEIQCPASKSSSAGSTMRRSTSMISGRGQRIAPTSARHSRGFAANYPPPPPPPPPEGGGGLLFPPPPGGEGEGGRGG